MDEELRLLRLLKNNVMALPEYLSEHIRFDHSMPLDACTIDMCGKKKEPERPLREAAKGWLYETWREMRNDSGQERRSYFVGAVDALKDIGLMTTEEQDGWVARSKRCPGHEDESGRGWCAYCGNLPPETTNG